MTDPNQTQDMLPQASTQDDESLSMTLGGVGRGDELPEGEIFDETAVAGGNSLLSHTNILIAVVAIVAVASLYLMRISQGDLSTSKESQEIEAQIANTLNRLNTPSQLSADDPLLAENLNALLTPTAEITAIFEYDVRDQQIPIEQVKKDPFSLVGGANDSSAGPDASEYQNSRRIAKLQGEISGFGLQSIMIGARNIAVIDGEFYKKGDTLGSFRVTDIDKFTVYLQVGGDVFELSLKNNNR